MTVCSGHSRTDLPERRDALGVAVERGQVERGEAQAQWGQA